MFRTSIKLSRYLSKSPFDVRISPADIHTVQSKLKRRPKSAVNFSSGITTYHMDTATLCHIPNVSLCEAIPHFTKNSFHDPGSQAFVCLHNVSMHAEL
jgi:hypothetical protein